MKDSDLIQIIYGLLNRIHKLELKIYHNYDKKIINNIELIQCANDTFYLTISKNGNLDSPIDFLTKYKICPIDFPCLDTDSPEIFCSVDENEIGAYFQGNYLFIPSTTLTNYILPVKLTRYLLGEEYTRTVSLDITFV